jgi:UDP-GlcNAc:undecaprenyl-phosphate GlcNAc-1-phosphate transferase
MEITPIAFIVSIAFAASLVLTLLVRKIARRIGMTDHPDGHRKLHRESTPHGGGLAVFLATVGVIALLCFVENPWQEYLRNSADVLFSLLLAGGVIVLVGVVDDIVGLRGRQKLFAQCVAASILMAGGLVIENVGIFDVKIELGLLALPFTLFWLLGAINAVNLLDGIDGLASTVGIILAVTIGVMAWMSIEPSEATPESAVASADAAIDSAGQVSKHEESAPVKPDHSESRDLSTEKLATAIIAFVFAGSLLGFMRFNFPPASIFLGDSGSMLIGLVVGWLAILGSFKGAGTVLLAAPLAVWTIPILDSGAAILRRRLSGRSIYATDRGHLHHRLLNLLGSNRKVLGFVAACCAFTSVAALVSVSMKSDLIAVVSGVAVVTLFVVTGIFGRAELLLLTSRLRHAGRSLMVARNPKQASATQISVRLQGSQRWELLWETLTDAADKLHMTKIHLDLSLPATQEGYTATWARSGEADSLRCWQIDIPLVVADRPVGRLMIVCSCNGESVCEQVERLLELLEPFEMHFRSLANGAPASPGPFAAAVVESPDSAVEFAPSPRQPSRHPPR